MLQLKLWCLKSFKYVDTVEIASWNPFSWTLSLGPSTYPKKIMEHWIIFARMISTHKDFQKYVKVGPGPLKTPMPILMQEPSEQRKSEVKSRGREVYGMTILEKLSKF